MYQSASEPALLCGINLLVIDRKPAPSPEVICLKTSVTGSRSWVQGQATQVPILWPNWSLTEKLEKMLCWVFFFGFFLKLKPPQTPKILKPKHYTYIKWCSYCGIGLHRQCEVTSMRHRHCLCASLHIVTMLVSWIIWRNSFTVWN